jgi:D-glycero-D-manno-heptose 1,7-bisphosphate phosphatase
LTSASPRITDYSAPAMLPSPNLARAAFVDRDGVINEERRYVHRIEDFVLLPSAVAGLRLLAEAGFKLVIVTNQAGVARGYFDEPAVKTLHGHIRQLLQSQHVPIDAIYYCPHHPEGTVPAYAIRCDCRKPAAGMLLQAERELQLDLSRSVIIGDKECDMEAGRQAGLMLAVLVDSGHALPERARAKADLVVADLKAAAVAITKSYIQARN